MLFNSFHFLVFLPLLAILYQSIPPRWRNGLLLVGSIYFYAVWNVYYLAFFLISIVSAYLGGQGMAACTCPRARRRWLVSVLALNLGMLGLFKYYNFVAGNLNALLAQVGVAVLLPSTQLLLPMGISFYTFQAIGYSVDVYRGHERPERSLPRLALFISFFPQLVAGPIERMANLMPQLKATRTVTPEHLIHGARRMLWGFFKKVVIADNLSGFVDQVFRHPQSHHGLIVVLGTLAFAVQIYCDFSGYCDIAIGAALFFGVRLMENFRRPYFATSLEDFWSRWHISLSTWFRDYVYIPLGGRRVSRSRAAGNLMATFLVSGIWHGANWTYLLWGGLHGFATLAERIFRRPPSGRLVSPFAVSAQRVMGWGLTMLVVLVGWVFFRADSLHSALVLLRHAAIWDLPEQAALIPRMLGGGGWLIFLGLCILVLFVVELLEERTGEGVSHLFSRLPPVARHAAYGVLLTVIFLGGQFSQQTFIYFQF